MLDGVAAATVEVAGAAVLAGGHADALGHGEKINALEGEAGITFLVSTGIVVANEAIDVGGVGEIVIGVGPAVAGVASGATVPIGLDADAIVVDEILFADGGGFVEAGDVDGFTGPIPMHGLADFVGGVFVAFKAGGGNFGAGLEGAFHEEGVVGVDASLGNEGPGVLGNGGIVGEEEDDGGTDEGDRG